MSMYLEQQKPGKDGAKKRYKILDFDQERGVMLLKGISLQFEQPFDKEWLKRMGYELINVEEEQDA